MCDHGCMANNPVCKLGKELTAQLEWYRKTQNSEDYAKLDNNAKKQIDFLTAQQEKHLQFHLKYNSKHATIEEGISAIYQKRIALHPNTVVAQAQLLNQNITREEILEYMKDTYGWKEDFYAYYGQDDQTDVDK